MAKKQTSIIAKHIQLLKLDVVKQKVDATAYNKAKEPKLQLGHRMLHNLKDERIKMELVFSFESDNNNEVIHFQFDFHFHIEQLSEHYELNEDKHPIFSGQLVATLIGICYSTARGVIFEKLKNAGVNDVLVPVIAPQDLMQSNGSKK